MAGPEEATAYEEQRAQLASEHPAHLPLLLERVRRLGKAEGGARDAAALRVRHSTTTLINPSRGTQAVISSTIQVPVC